MVDVVEIKLKLICWLFIIVFVNLSCLVGFCSDVFYGNGNEFISILFCVFCWILIVLWRLYGWFLWW